MPFYKGHTINVGKHRSLETREKISAAQRKPKIERQCVCGVTFYVHPSRLKYNRGTFCSKKCLNQSKIGKTSWNKGLIGFRAGEKRPGVMPKGEAHWSYKKDRSHLKAIQSRMDSAYQDWRKRVYERDSNTCRISNNDCRGRIEAHHILPWRDFPELRYETENGITLCHAHHPHKWEDEKKLAPIFQELVTLSKGLQ